MSIKIGDYDFEGPFSSEDDLNNQSGVYVILGKEHSHDTDYLLIDIGQAGEVRERIETHDRADCWEEQECEELAFAVRYVDKAERMKIERELRKQYDDIPCGER